MMEKSAATAFVAACPPLPRRDPTPLPSAPAPPGPSPTPAPQGDGKKHSVTFSYDPDGHDEIDHLTLQGSWDKNGVYSDKGSQVPMQRGADGKWRATVDVLDDKPHDWRWTVLADGPSGKQQPAVFEPEPLRFSPTAKGPGPSYAPTSLTSMGAQRHGDDVSFTYWAPYAKQVNVLLWSDVEGKATRVPTSQDPTTGRWSVTLPAGWNQWQGAVYAYEITRKEGDVVVRSDPWGRFRQGQQRGLAEVLVDPKTGKEVPPINPESGQPPAAVRFIRFEVQGHPQATAVTLRLADEKGNPLDKAGIAARLGTDGGNLVRGYQDGAFSDFWVDNVADDGAIALTPQGGAWAAMVNNPEKLAGLRYTFEVTENGPDGRPVLLGDTNGDGVLQPDEARRTAFNDAFSNIIQPKYGWDRYNVLRESSRVWQHDNVRRTAEKPEQMITYEMHVGSFLGDGRNVRRSTFKDVIDKLDYLKDLGVNTIEFMPVNAYEGARDWGYVGTNSLGVAEQYGFEDSDGSWVCGPDALKRVIDEAHGKGFRVLNDVVYNHWGLRYNDMENTDSLQNPWFDWGRDPSKGPQLRPQRYGPLPAYNNPQVRQFIVDSAAQQMDEYHFDGLRVDAINLIHEGNGGGGDDGWKTLQKMNSTIKFFHPNVTLTAEQFPNEDEVTHPVSQGGAGFDSMWDAEFHRELTRGGVPIGGILEAAAKRKRTLVQLFNFWLQYRPAFDRPTNAVTIVTDHDEVGNSKRTISTAMADKPGLPTPWASGAAKASFGVSVFAPGMPLMFQGEESMADNAFLWGRPTTWDMGWDWQAAPTAGPKLAEYLIRYDGGIEDAAHNVMRHWHHDFCKDALALRASSPALAADASLDVTYGSDGDSVLAYKRQASGEEFLVVASFNHSPLSHYNIGASGKWQLVLNSDDAKYGGTGDGRETVSDGRFDLPAGGVLVYRRC
jgi:1,4-alpha-glucan branching enzyme